MLRHYLDGSPFPTPDGLTPFFVEAGAAPTAGNAAYPPGSIVRFGTTYYLQTGTLAAPVWTSLATLITPTVLALLSTGLLKNTAGVLSTAFPGVDYTKGPGKLFSTVRNVAAGQTLSIPVVDGENNGYVRATGRLISDGTDRVITPKINGSGSNVTYQEAFGSNVGAGADRGGVGSTGVYGAFFHLLAFTAKTGNALKRFGFLWVVSASATLANVMYSGAFHFKDTTTTITSIDLDCGNATGLAANSEALVEEGIVS
jgi:hypothetical protein